MTSRSPSRLLLPSAFNRPTAFAPGNRRAAVASALVGVSVGVVGAYVTAIWAFRRFRHEKLWERKHEAYVRLLEAFHTMDVSIRRIQADESNRTDEEKSRYGSAVGDVVHAVNVGKLILSAGTIAVLEHFRRRNREIDYSKQDSSQKYSEIRALIVESLDKIVCAARKDLEIEQ